MSNALGQVLTRSGEVIGYFEYYGTADVCNQTIWPTSEEVYAHWRKDDPNECACHQQPEEVFIYTSYGNGFCWIGKACRHCMAIISPRMPFDWDDGESTTVLGGHPFPDKWVDSSSGTD